ncbi:MAG TPA: class I SAM-dependent methyltransferase [Roseiflexaceae bacterium]|nr:class I SAM-dependent methyltransferase [Roseiflexaceae bacterium]
MESIQGERALRVDALTLISRLASYYEVLIDIGTGDGRFVRHMAIASPARFAIGVDACRENLRANSRSAPPNALYLITEAHALPEALDRQATQLTINFPWGSLLAGLLMGEPALLGRLAAVARPNALLELRLNAGALAEAGWSLDDGGERIRQSLRAVGFGARPPIALGQRELHTCPTNWARRLACGRDPRGLYIRGVYHE